MLLLHWTAEPLSSRCTSDAGHHPALQVGENAQQLALPGRHHWCTAVCCQRPREDLQVACCASRLARNYHFLLAGDCHCIIPARTDYLGTVRNVYTERAQRSRAKPSVPTVPPLYAFHATRRLRPLHWFWGMSPSFVDSVIVCWYDSTKSHWTIYF